MRLLPSTTTPALGLGQPLLSPQQSCLRFGGARCLVMQPPPPRAPLPLSSLDSGVPGGQRTYIHISTHTYRHHTSAQTSCFVLWPCSAQGPKAAFGQPAASGPAFANGCGPEQAFGFFLLLLLLVQKQRHARKTPF